MLIVNLDTTKLKGKELHIKATVSSAGEEVNNLDNHVIDLVKLTQLSEIDVVGRSSIVHENINVLTALNTISHQVQIINNGPSTVDQLIVILQLPISIHSSQNRIISAQNVSVSASYKNAVLKVTQMQDNLFTDVTNDENDESETTISSTEPVIALDFAPKVVSNTTSHRRRRELEIDQQEKSSSINYDYLEKLPTNKTTFVDCIADNADLYECFSISIMVKNFQRSKDPIQILLNFTFLFEDIDRLMFEEKNILVFQTNVELQNPTDEEGTSLRVRQNLPFTIIYKQFAQKAPIWIYVAAGVAGFLLLLVLSLILYKMGFFKREKKEELERLTKEVS